MDGTPLGQGSTARAAYREAVLTAPLWLPSPKWSSRSIADALGVSQSSVARIWRDAAAARPTVSSRLESALPRRTPSLLGVLIVPAGSCVVLGPDSAPAVRHRAALPGSLRSRHRVRALLGADLVRDQIDSHGTAVAVDDFWRAVHEAGHRGPELVIVSSGHVATPETAPAALICPAPTQWQGLLGALSTLPETCNRERLAELEGRLRRWYQASSPPSGRVPFTWVAAQQPSEPRELDAAGNPGRRPAPARALADDIVVSIREGLTEGTFAGDDEIPERVLAQRLHCSPGRIRQALRLLADEGLVTVSTDRSVVVRVPAVADVVETYAARRALGTIAVRAATRWSEEGRAPVERLLGELARCAERKDVDRAQQVDLAFQDALFRSAGLTRISPMLETLSKQTLVFISVLGIRYAYPPERIVMQDRAIFDAIMARDRELAAQAWQAKIDEGARYMADQLAHWSGTRRIRRSDRPR